MSKTLYISHYCHIRNGKLALDGKVLFQGEPNMPFSDFLKKSYRFLEMKYPKYFKMDHLSKLSVLGAELILKGIELEKYDHDIALCFANRASSLDTDRKHQQTINEPDNYYPSPAVFVYTLPNIGMGEVSIRHGLKSENSFFIFEAFKPDFHRSYSEQLIHDRKTRAVLNAWVEVDEGKYDGFMYIVSEKGERKHTTKNIKELYHKTI